MCLNILWIEFYRSLKCIFYFWSKERLFNHTGILSLFTECSPIPDLIVGIVRTEIYRTFKLINCLVNISIFISTMKEYQAKTIVRFSVILIFIQNLLKQRFRFCKFLLLEKCDTFIDCLRRYARCY